MNLNNCLESLTIYLDGETYETLFFQAAKSNMTIGQYAAMKLREIAEKHEDGENICDGISELAFAVETHGAGVRS